MSVRLMHLADIHLGVSLPHLGGKAGERAQDLESALSRALSLAPDKKVDAILISGDLFDHFDPPPALVERVKSIFERVAGRGIPLILIPGTHDSHRYSRCVYLRERFPGADVLLEPGKPIRKLLNNQTVNFYGFSGSKPGEAASTNFRPEPTEGLHIALVHGAVADGREWGVSPRDFSVARQAVENSGFHYVALGHYHNFKEFKYGRTGAAYPGTLEGLKFGENGDRYLVIAEVDAQGVLFEKSRHNLRTLQEVTLDLALSGIASNEALAAKIRSYASPDVIAKVCLSGSADFLPAKKELEARLAGEFFHLQIADETSVYDSGLIHSLQNERTVQGIFIRKMLKEIEQAMPEQKAVAELALRLAIEQFQQVGNETQRDLS